jgi:K+-transporting ATPase ATPase C chain
MRTHLRPALGLLLVLTVVTGGLYPALVTALASLLVPVQAGGSVLSVDGRAVGSRLVGQSFTGASYLHGRPSATSARPYDGAASSGSNLGPTSATLDSLVRVRAAALRTTEGLPADAPLPVDLLTASGSGLDPHVSPAAAALQAPRIARERGIPTDSVARIVAAATAPRWIGLVGEPRVNVLLVNLLLDGHVPSGTIQP